MLGQKQMIGLIGSIFTVPEECRDILSTVKGGSPND